MTNNSPDRINTERNYELPQAIDASAETSEDGQKDNPKSLQDLVLALIAQDPCLSMQLIQNKSFDDSHIPEVLTKITPFIQLLPKELKCELLTFLPIRDWNSLFKVNTEWRQLVTTAAELFLNTVACDKPTVISVDNFEKIVNNLLEKVESYSQKTRRRPEQVNEVKKLKKEVSSLILPLAKLFRCQKKLDEIQRAITREYGTKSMILPFFRGVNNSQLYHILESSSREIQKLTDSSWFKKVQFCANLCPNHVVAKQFSDALLETKALEDDFKPPVLLAIFNN